MASSQIRLVIESGDLASGFSVGLQCFDHHSHLVLMARGQLPAQPELRFKYRVWKKNYLQWGGTSRLDPIANEPVNGSFLEQVQSSAEDLALAMNTWLQAETVRLLLQKLYQVLSPDQETTLILQTQHIELLRLPWLKWTLFDDFPALQFVLSPDEFRAISAHNSVGARDQVNILAVMATGSSVNTTGDRFALEQLPQTSLSILSEPTRQDITDQLWLSPWDIFCFAGHSSSQFGQGKFTIAREEWIQTSEIRFGLQKAAQNGLKLAIFNSCDGLAIAQDLVQNDIPFIITMREPVPDDVAQVFLRYFLEAYSHGQSLYQAFSQANKRLESFEHQCPCATWLPVMMCNPTVPPPKWQDFVDPSPIALTQERRPLPLHSARKRFRALFLLGAMLLFLGVRSSGLFQGLELWSLDWMLQTRPQELPDQRMLVVEVDEAWLQSQHLEPGSISDQTLNQAIQILRQHQPRVIGVDIYRDHPVLEPELSRTFQTVPNVIGVCKSPDPEHDLFGVSSPHGLPVSRLGFSDILEDEDGVVRRQILFMGLSPTKTCATPWSFSSQLALQYLKHDKIQPQFSKAAKEVNQHLMLGQRAFHPIRRFWSGYQNVSLGGNQILLNYRALPRLRDIAPTVSLADVLMDRVPDEQIRDRVIMIGVTANTTADFWETPRRSMTNRRIPGVFLQAHMVSQVMSAVLDGRPLLHVLPRWSELLLLLGIGSLGLISPTRTRWRWFVSVLVVCSCTVLSVVALASGLWLPLIPAIVSFLLIQQLHRFSIHGGARKGRTLSE